MAAPELKRAVDRLKVHDHACLIYETPDEQFGTAVPFLIAGLARHEYCGYIADGNSSQAVLTAFREHHSSVSEDIERGHFALLTKRETYFHDGEFEPDKMIGFVRHAAEDAMGKGFTGARFTGEMTWHLGSGVSARDLLIYESKLNYLLAELPLTGICQYNLSRFSPRILLGILETHPVVIFKDVVARNHYFVPPDEFLGEEQDERTRVQRYLENIVEREKSADALRDALHEAEDSKRQLIEKVCELEEFQEAVVGRELKMIALENELKRLRGGEKGTDT